MKKTLKIVGLLSVMLLLVFVLTGCGNKLVATKDMTADKDGFNGKAKYEIKFDGDNIESVKMTMKFDEESEAKEYYDIMEMAKSFMGDEVSFEVKLDGKDLIMEFDKDAFAQMDDEFTGKTKKEIKESLEEDGWKVK